MHSGRGISWGTGLGVSRLNLSRGTEFIWIREERVWCPAGFCYQIYYRHPVVPWDEEQSMLSIMPMIEASMLWFPVGHKIQSRLIRGVDKGRPTTIFTEEEAGE